MSIWQSIGWTGSAACITAFWLLTAGKLKSTDWCYNALNLYTAIALISSALEVKNYPIVGLEAVWGSIAGWGLLKNLSPKKNTHPPE